MPRRLWTMPMLGFLRGTDARPIANGFQTIGEYLRGHVGFWDRVNVTTGATGIATITHNCGFTPSAAFVQAIYDGTSPHNHYGPINIVSLNETTLTVILLRANGNDDANSARTLYYHILPKVNE